ncbi:MAG: hypothetical protein LKI03_06280 [Acetobacter indonesiensis]|jgi:hypothetical protein|nr:hypothetical protein [Acetobacter indonesiensis]MCI1546194.1 hypothetical protein [Acetobacter indonesiensis]MCI1765639.1 hypothetical protein [Acetobacter indonesiensis]
MASKILTYARQPTTLIGLSLTIGALVGNVFGVISEAVSGTILTATLPLWVSDLSAQAKIGAIEGVIVAATHGTAAAKSTTTKN